MIEIEKINDGCDIKAEVIAADLLERGVDADKMAILPAGAFSRKYRKDVLSFAERNTALDSMYYALTVSRDGIYEHLPQALFHQTVRKASGQPKSFEERLEDVRKIKEEQAEAKKFFSVLEREINHTRIMIEIKERNSIFGLTDDSHSDLFLDVWPEIKEIDGKYRRFLFQILPLAHKCRTDRHLSQTLLSYVLDLPVEIASENEPYFIPADAEVSSKYGYYLGIDAILGRQNPVYEDMFVIHVREVPADLLPDFIEGGASMRVIRFLLEYFLPFDADHRIEVHVKKEDSGLVLNNEGKYSYLSYNSTL